MPSNIVSGKDNVYVFANFSQTAGLVLEYFI